MITAMEYVRQVLAESKREQRDPLDMMLERVYAQKVALLLTPPVNRMAHRLLWAAIVCLVVAVLGAIVLVYGQLVLP